MSDFDQFFEECFKPRDSRAWEHYCTDKEHTIIVIIDLCPYCGKERPNN